MINEKKKSLVNTYFITIYVINLYEIYIAYDRTED